MAIEGIIDTSFTINIIQSNIPTDLKSKGIDKLSQIISDQSNKIPILILPLALKFAQELGIDPNNLSIPDICPSEDTLNTILPPLNGLVDNLNQIGDLLTNITKIVGSAALGGQILQTTSDTLNNILPILQAAIIAIPPPALPGAVVGAESVISYINEKILQKKDGSPVLPPINAAIGSAAINLAVASGFILLVLPLLETIIILLKKCFPEVNINVINSNVSSLATAAKPKDQINLLEKYKGFNLEIINVPFNDTLTQRKAVARNQSGEIVLQTELSFTTENNTLITELKNIIDTSGLVGDYVPSVQPPPIDQDLFAEPFIGDKEVKIQILNNRIFQEQTKLNQETAKFLTQNKLDAYLRIPVPKYILPITTTNYTQNDILFRKFINEVNSRYPTDPESNSKKTLDKNVPILKLLFGNLRPYINNINVLLGEISFVEGKALKVDIPLNGLNTPSAISVLNP